MGDGHGDDGSYCAICGGIPPDKITTKRILIDGKETGIDQLDWILSEVKKLGRTHDDEIGEEILRRVREFNYVPTKKADLYVRALVEEYKKFPGET